MPAETYHDFPLSDDYNWDAGQVEPELRRWASSDGSGDKEKIDWTKLKQVYFWHDSGKLENFEQLKFPYCRIEGGRPHVVHNAVQNALARIEGSNIPESDKPCVRRVAERQMRRFNQRRNSSMGKPTEQQLQIINSKFSQTPLTADDCFVFSNLMIDNLPTSYYSIIQPALLNTFMEDTKQGIALLLVHNNKKLPVGRSFDARIKNEYVADVGKEVLTLYGDFYIPLGIALEGGMTTDDIARGIDTGINFATSIGFSAKRWDCSICGNDIRDYRACPHIPGKKYAVEKNGRDVVETCYVLVGSDGEGSLDEDSFVFAGACSRARVVSNYSKGVNDFDMLSKLHLMDDFKNIPLNTKIYQYFTKDGSVLFVDTDKHTGGSEFLKRRSEEEVELAKFKEVLSKMGIEFTDENNLESAINKFVQGKVDAYIKSIADSTTTFDSSNYVTKDEFDKVISEKDATITELTKKNEELLEKAELAETYRKDLINKALEAGIRAQGNVFPKDMFEKFLNTLTIDEIKKVIDDFNAEFNSKFEGARVTESKSSEKRFSSEKEPTSKDDFESEEEFRNYIADKAVEYARENKVSIKEATKILYSKFNKDGEK